jgi:hypothetical protein
LPCKSSRKFKEADMPHDKNGVELQKDDKVTLALTIQEIFPGAEKCNVAALTETGESYTLTADQLEKAPAISEIDPPQAADPGQLTEAQKTVYDLDVAALEDADVVVGSKAPATPEDAAEVTLDKDGLHAEGMGDNLLDALKDAKERLLFLALPLTTPLAGVSEAPAAPEPAPVPVQGLPGFFEGVKNGVRKFFRSIGDKVEEVKDDVVESARQELARLESDKEKAKLQASADSQALKAKASGETPSLTRAQKRQAQEDKYFKDQQARAEKAGLRIVSEKTGDTFLVQALGVKDGKVYNKATGFSRLEAAGKLGL